MSQLTVKIINETTESWLIEGPLSKGKAKKKFIQIYNDAAQKINRHMQGCSGDDVSLDDNHRCYYKAVIKYYTTALHEMERAAENSNDETYSRFLYDHARLFSGGIQNATSALKKLE